MPDAVCWMLTLLCTLVVACPIGTNPGLPHLLWMPASGRRLVRTAARQCAADEVLVPDAGFGVALLQEEGTPRYVVRLAKNATPATPTTLAEAT